MPATLGLALAASVATTASAQSAQCCEFIPASAWDCEGDFFFMYCEYQGTRGGTWTEERWLQFGGPADSTRCAQVPIECNDDFDCGAWEACANGQTLDAACVPVECYGDWEPHVFGAQPNRGDGTQEKPPRTWAMATRPSAIACASASAARLDHWCGKERAGAVRGTSRPWYAGAELGRLSDASVR